AELVLYAALIITIGGIGLGLLGGLRPGLVDMGVIAISTLSAAMPSFVAAVVLLLVFSVQLGWFPALGTGSGFVGTIDHLTLPAIALAATSLALVARVTRAAVREEMGREHVQTAIGRGIPFPLVVRRHVLRNAAIPIVTVSGLTIASLIAVAAVIETAFNLNGLGEYLVTAALNNDFATVQGISMVLVTVFVVTNAIVDVLYAVLDPRVKLGTRAR
ncbi:MAG: ABC transporter permease, partial [Actinomycetota bacterium]|nr:ABC transporter permease [Actinomycetota bacterium]